MADDLVEHLVVQHRGNLVDRIHVPGRNHGLFGHVAEQGDLAPVIFRQRPVGAAEEYVSLYADLAKFLHRVLRRLGLDLARRCDVGHQRQVYVADVVAAQLQAHLPDRFQKRQRFDIAHGTADLDDRHFSIACAALDEGLDLVGDVRDDLHRPAQVVSAALLADHAFVDLPRGEVVPAPHPGRLKALVVAQIEVGFGAILGDEHLPVLERAHGARIHVDIRVELDVGDFDAARFEDRCEGGGGYPLAERGYDTAGNKNVFGHSHTNA